MAERTDDRPAEAGLHLERGAGVEHDVDHLAHVVDAPAVARDDVEDLGDESRLDVVARSVGRVRPRRGREVAEVGAHEVERARVVVGDVVDQTARERDRRTAEVLLRDRLAHRLEHDGRAGREDRRVAAHHREVGDRRDQRTVTGRRAEDRGDERHPAGAPRLGEHVGRRGRGDRAVGAVTGAFQHHDERHAVGGRDLRDPVALRVRGRVDRAGLHREVLGRDHHRAAVDPARTHDDRVGRRVLAADERAELLERSRSSRWAMRARTSSLPASRCLRSRSSPPIAREASRRRARSSRTSSHPSEPLVRPWLRLPARERRRAAFHVREERFA